MEFLRTQASEGTISALSLGLSCLAAVEGFCSMQACGMRVRLRGGETSTQNGMIHILQLSLLTCVPTEAFIKKEGKTCPRDIHAECYCYGCGMHFHSFFKKGDEAIHTENADLLASGRGRTGHPYGIAFVERCPLCPFPEPPRRHVRRRHPSGLQQDGVASSLPRAGRGHGSCSCGRNTTVGVRFILLRAWRWEGTERTTGSSRDDCWDVSLRPAR